jgi:hypothetical protein
MQCSVTIVDRHSPPPSPYYLEIVSKLMGAYRGHSPNFLGVARRFRGPPHQKWVPRNVLESMRRASQQVARQSRVLQYVERGAASSYYSMYRCIYLVFTWIIIPCVTDRGVLVPFRIGTNAKRFYISARIQMNFRDNFIILTVLWRPKRDASNSMDYIIIGQKLTEFLSKTVIFLKTSY